MSKKQIGEEMDNLANRIEWAVARAQILSHEKDELRIKTEKAKAHLTKLRGKLGAKLVAEVQFTAIDGITHQQLETAIHNVLLNQISTITDKIAGIHHVTARTKTEQ